MPMSGGRGGSGGASGGRPRASGGGFNGGRGRSGGWRGARQSKPERTFRAARGKKYLAFYKPFEVLCQFTPEKLPDGTNSDKVTLADFGFPPDVYPVGRLDYDSEGLLILSDDSRLTTRLFDGQHARTYLAQIENQPSDENLLRLEQGVPIEGKRTLPCQAWVLEEEPRLPERSKPIRFRKNIPTYWLELTIFEGRNRQVRKMTAYIGHPTLRLLRVAIGGLALFDLGIKPGEWVELDVAEIEAVFDG